MTVSYSIYFTDHLGVKKKINIDNIVDLDENILEISNHKLYATFAFTTNGIYYKPDIIGDLVERIEFKYKIDDNEEKSLKFVIDGIDYLPHNNIRVYCKTKGIKYAYKYSGSFTGFVRGDSLKEILDNLIDLPKNYDNLTNIPFYFDYEANDKSVEEIIEDLSKITLFDYYFKDGVIYFEDKKVIEKDAKAVKRFSEITDILNFSTSLNNDNKKINKIVFNTNRSSSSSESGGGGGDITADASILIEANPTELCLSPKEPLIFVDEDKQYTINPVNGVIDIYFSPQISTPSVNKQYTVVEKTIIEKFHLQNDDYVRLKAGIKELIAIEGVENYTYKEGYNVIAFDKVDNGELKVRYKTDVLRIIIPPQQEEKDILINVSHFGEEKSFTYKIKANGYYPKPYTAHLNTINVFGVDAENAAGSIAVYKKDDDGNYQQVNWLGVDTDDFGDFRLQLDEYGVYKLEFKSNVRYLAYFVNKFDIENNDIEVEI